MFIAADDQTVVVTILPQVMLDLKVQVTTELDRASWIITGYLLGYLVAMPLIGRLSDTWGHRRLFIASMALFMVGSVAVALPSLSLDLGPLGLEYTNTLSWLIAARVFQAVGAGALVPISIAIVGDLFPSGRRAIPLGLIGASAEAGAVIGPLWGGIIINYLDWRWVFWINVPLGAAVLVALVMLVRPSPRFPAKVDYLGGVLIGLSLASITLGLARTGEPDLLMALYLGFAVATFVLFVGRERSTDNPLLPPSMFRVRAFSAANGTHLLVGGALIIAMVTIPLMANTAMQLTPLEGGLRLLRLMAAIPVGAVLGGVACQRFEYRVPAMVGLGLMAVGFLFMSGWEVDVSDPILTVHLAMAGLGFGLLITPIALAATESVGEQNRGTAAATVTAMRMTGMTVGLATLTAWGSDRFKTLAGDIPLPLGGSAAQVQEGAAAFEAQVTEAGMTLFGEFFLIAMAVSLVALIPAALMVWRKGRPALDFGVRRGRGLGAVGQVFDGEVAE